MPFRPDAASMTLGAVDGGSVPDDSPDLLLIIDDKDGARAGALRHAES